MTGPIRFATDLTLLTEAVADAAVDLSICFAGLIESAQGAVPTYLGLSVDIESDPPVRLVDRVGPTHAAALRIRPVPPGAPDDPAPAMTVCVFASAPDALVDLGADLTHLLGLNLSDVEIDTNAELAEAGELRDMTTVNLATGILIDSGYDPDQARRRLAADAVAAGSTVVVAADRIVGWYR